jgi:2-oxoglutarate ferredoxin oxidoreductase subunit beta
MKRNIFDRDGANISWCPGCGNFQILDTLKETLADLDLSPENVVIVSGIGQAGKTPHYLSCNMFNGLHGRTLPLATGISAGNPGLTVFAVGGDGDMYGEGGNHFIHAIRRNPDITNIVHNNMVYGLTKGQASPTSQRQFVTPVQVHGVSHEPFNPVAMAITLNASFVARAFSGDKEQTSRILKKAVRHRGYALVDMRIPTIGPTEWALWNGPSERTGSPWVFFIPALRNLPSRRACRFMQIRMSRYGPAKLTGRS